MRHLALLALYALIAALVLPGSILAQDEAAPGTATAPAEPQARAGPAAEPAPAARARRPPSPPAGPAEPARAARAAVSSRTSAQTHPRPKAIAAASGSVAIADFTFSPASITISQGDTVTWNNNGPTPHSATANDGSFDTGIFPKGQSRSHTFNEAGTFSYICTPPVHEGHRRGAGAQSGGMRAGRAASTATRRSTGAPRPPRHDGPRCRTPAPTPARC